MSDRRNTLSRMTDDEITNLMDSISSAEDTDGADSTVDFDSDDDVPNPAWNTMENDILIDQCLQYNSSDIVIDAINASLNVNNLDLNEAGLNDGEASATSTPLPLHLPDAPPAYTFEPVLDAPLAFAFETVSDEPSSISAATTPVPELPRLRKRKRTSSIGNELQEEEGGPNTSTTGQFTGAANEMRNDSSEFKKLLWKKKNLQVHVNEVICRGPKEMPPAIAALKTPYDCFDYFLPEAFLQELADQMNLYAHQLNVESRFNTNAYEVRKFIGILFFMSMFRYPNVRTYWGKYAMSPIANTMTRKRFDQMRQYLQNSGRRSWTR